MRDQGCVVCNRPTYPFSTTNLIVDVMAGDASKKAELFICPQEGLFRPHGIPHSAENAFDTCRFAGFIREEMTGGGYNNRASILASQGNSVLFYFTGNLQLPKKILTVFRVDTERITEIFPQNFPVTGITELPGKRGTYHDEVALQVGPVKCILHVFDYRTAVLFAFLYPLLALF